MIIMKTELLIKKVLGKTKADGFKELAEGDIITLSVPLYNPGQRGDSGGGCYATEVRLYCEAKNIGAQKSMAQMHFTLSKFFVLEELE